jgi:hypothetical protein
MQTRNPDWRTIVLTVMSSLSAIAVLGFAVLTTLMAFFQPAFSAVYDNTKPFESILLACTLMLVSAAFIPTIYFNVQRLTGKDIPAPASKAITPWLFISLIAAWVASSFLAQILYNNDSVKWISPIFYLLATILPAWFLLQLGTGGLNFGSRLRGWSILSTGMALGTSISAAAEIGLAIVGLLGLGVYLGFNPAQFAFFKNLAEQIANGSNLDNMMGQLSPMLMNPLTIAIGLLFFSVFAPLIEETSKSLTVWLLFDRLESPMQGFVAGALSGAGFGLLESLLASASPDSSWAYTLLVRGLSTMMHILAASLTGWGIASYRLNKKTGRLIGMYALAMLLHSLWNASVVMIVVGSLRVMNQTAAPDAIGTALIGLSSLIMLILCLSLPIAAGTINWQMRKSIAPAAPLPITDEANQAGVQ